MSNTNKYLTYNLHFSIISDPMWMTTFSKVNIPLIASGGVGNLDHLVEGIKSGKASAVLAASIFHYGKHSVKEAKQYLESKGIPVRT